MVMIPSWVSLGWIAECFSSFFLIKSNINKTNLRSFPLCAPSTVNIQPFARTFIWALYTFSSTSSSQRTPYHRARRPCVSHLHPANTGSVWHSSPRWKRQTGLGSIPPVGAVLSLRLLRRSDTASIEPSGVSLLLSDIFVRKHKGKGLYSVFIELLWKLISPNITDRGTL